MPTNQLTRQRSNSPGQYDIRAFSFRNQWMNFCLYLPQFMYKTKNNPNKNSVCGFLIPDRQNRLKGNNQPIGGDQKDTIWLANGDNFKSAFIKVDKRDLVNMYTRFPDKHGLSSVETGPLNGEYRKDNDTRTIPNNIIYFFRGLRGDCLKFLRSKNIV